MKKLLSLLTAMVLTLSVGVVPVMATGSSQISEPFTFTFTKKYETSDGREPSVLPKETIEFDVVATEKNPDKTMITIDPYTVEKATGEVKVNVPSYTIPGIWYYTVTEVPGDAQGVTYYSKSFTIRVVASYDDNDIFGAEAIIINSDGEKYDKPEKFSVTNTYDVTDPGIGLTVSKQVSGNKASKTQKFDIDVTFTTEKGKKVYSDIDAGGTYIYASDWKLDEETGCYSATKTVSLAAGETASFGSLPSGISYKVVEASKYQEEDKSYTNPEKGYTVTYTNDEGPINLKSNVETVVTNTKNKSINPFSPSTTPTSTSSTTKTNALIPNTGDTGVMWMYAGIVGVAVVALGILFFVRKRYSEK